MNQLTRRGPRWLQNDVFGTADPRSLWPVSRLHQEMNRLFTEAFRGIDDDGEAQGGWSFNPVVDVEQQEDQYEISVELPGVAMNDINVEMKEDVLMISGSKERKKTTGQGEQQRSERIYGTFQRTFRLPEDAVDDKINARFRDGVLTLTIPRDESRSRVESRRIEIEDGTSRKRVKGGASDEEKASAQESE
jgi:HSP20 family protein